MELDHINIKASKEQLAEVRDFYCDVLGLTTGFRPSLSSPGYWLYSKDRALMHLTEIAKDLGNNSDHNLDHIAFRKQGLSEFLQVLKNRRIDASVITNSETRMTQVFFNDPCGIKVEICFLGESPDDSVT